MLLLLGRVFKEFSEAFKKEVEAAEAEENNQEEKEDGTGIGTDEGKGRRKKKGAREHMEDAFMNMAQKRNEE